MLRNKIKIHKCGVYIRVSKNVLEQKTSLVNQRELFIQHAKKEGWEIVDFYVDIETGTSTKRPELLRLLKDVENKKVNLIAAKELSRLARNVEYAHKIKRLAETSDTNIVVLDGSINTLESKSSLFGLYAWIYEHEAQATSNRIKHILRTRAELGLFNGGTPPYGYMCKDGKLYIREDDTPNIVRRIFSEYISGKGIDTIARNLFNEDVPTPSMIAGKSNANNKWHGSTVKGILTNQAYIGNMVQLKESVVSIITKHRKVNDTDKMVIIENTHEPIVSIEDFKLVQELLVQRSHKKYHQSFHLFTGIMFCNDCGKGMHFKRNRRGYVCGSFDKHGQKACSCHIIREEELCNLILQDIKGFINSLNSTSYLEDLKKSVSKHVSEHEKSIKNSTLELNKLNARKLNALQLYTDSEISKEDYHLLVDSTKDEMARLELKIQESKQAINKLTSETALNELTKIKKELLNFNELTPNILHRFIKRIEVKEDGTPIVFYRFPMPK